jgi:2,4-dienoyl-CoA reductase-like NADH-dependent reductase (Old Yellow Enzyme family)
MRRAYELLLSPLRVGKLTLPNRIAMPPMATFLAEADGLVTRGHIEHYRNTSGPGLVFVEGAAVLPEGRISKRQLGIYSEGHLEGLARLAQVIHGNGAVAGIQLHHAGALAFIETWKKGHRRTMGRIWRLLRQQLMVSGLRRIRAAFQEAGRKAMEAGYDVIELHGAHGYLFSQFLSPLTNRRRDRYGGGIENRRRLLLEVYRGVREIVGDRSLVTCRLGVVDRHKRGLALAEGLSTASALVSEGAMILDVSSGSGVPKHIRPLGSKYSGLLHLAKAVKSAVKVPVMGGGSIHNPDLAEQALRDGMADVMAIGRGILADPAWARKTIAGRPGSILTCRQCRICCHFTDSLKCPSRQT